MLTSSNIHRSIANVGINLQRRMEARRHIGDFYGQGEVEFQAQYAFSGQLDTEPAENIIHVPFTVVFVGDPGNQRDSTLDRPQARLSTELTLSPAGTMSYHHVAGWTYDSDFNYTGAKVMVGVHCPAMSMGNPPVNLNFAGILHAAFQGFGSLWDPDSPLDGG